MSTNTIYVFSGSGNCLDIAKNIAKKLGDTDVVLMRSAPEKTDATDSKRVGFVFPCYAGGLPGGVEERVRAVKIAPGTYTFGVTSCSAYPGIGLSVLNSIHPLDFWSVVTHHCSCIWLFPHELMMPMLNVEKAQERSERLAALIGAQVLAGEKNRKAPKANAFNKAEASAWPVLSKKKAEKLRSTDACIACGQCVRLCPKGNIRIEGGRAVFGTDCIGCLACLQYCPQEAIHMGGVTVRRERYHNPKVPASELMEKIIHID